MSTLRLASLTLLGLALCIASAASNLVISEAAPYFALAGSEGARFQILAVGGLKPGPSLVSKKLALDECFTAINSLYGKAQPTERRAQMLKACQTIAAGITSSTPSYSYGWYIKAIINGELRDRQGLNAALARSQATAPNEGWLGQLRVELAEGRLAELDPSVREGNDRDLRMLVLSTDGVASVARLYIDNPAFREHITLIVDTLDDDTKRRFLAAVRHAAPPS